MGTGKPKELSDKGTFKEIPIESLILDDIFHGELIKGSLLNQFAKEKSKEYYEDKIFRELQPKYEEKGYYFEKSMKDKIIVHKDKPIDEVLEDQVWILFQKLGFLEMNKDRHFKINAGPRPIQIDVFAKDEYNVFVVSCKSKIDENSSNTLEQEIHTLSDLKKDLTLSIQRYYNKPIRVSFLLATKNIIWKKTEEDLAKNKKIFFWKEEDLEAYNELVDQLGKSAKYQIYASLFRDKETPEVGGITVPAIVGGPKSNRYYSFLIQPEKLFPVIYIHRREKVTAKELNDSYQRMVSKNRLKQIADYIDKGHSFCNSIIMCFHGKKKPTFEPHPKVEEIEGISYGTLTFPPYYGCAWIIDGQHRVYGYSKSDKASVHKIPVIAFESLEIKDQANLFIDINREQVPVSQNLLWDLYPDIYEDSEDKEQKLLRAVSLTTKQINSDKDSPLKDDIKIPSLTKSSKKPILTLENICRIIKDNRFLNEDNGLLYEESYEKTIDITRELIENYFKEIKDLFDKEWELGRKGMIKSNVGIRIFLILLRQTLRYFSYKGEEYLYKNKRNLDKFKGEINKLFTPLKKKIEALSENEKQQIRSSSGGSVLNNAKLMAWWIKETYPEFGLEILKNYAYPKPKEITDTQIRELLEDTEKSLRKFIIEKLKEKYGGPWWKQGIPQEVKDSIEENIKRDSLNESEARKKELLSLDPERKINGYTDTSSFRQIIKIKLNWDFFQNIFLKDKEYTLSQFKSFEKARNKYSHNAEQELYEDEKNLGFWGMKWIRRYIGLDTPKNVLVS